MSDTSIEKGVEDRPDLAKILYDLRQHLTLTQSQMAEQLGISQAMVSAIEKGRTEPSSKLADKILNYSKTLEEREAKASESHFGEWLREQRAKHNLTQAELAEKAGISQLTISFIETGKTQSPQKATISAIEKALGRGLPTEVKTEISEETEVGGLGEYFGPFPLEDWEANVVTARRESMYSMIFSNDPYMSAKPLTSRRGFDNTKTSFGSNHPS